MQAFMTCSHSITKRCYPTVTVIEIGTDIDSSSNTIDMGPYQVRASPVWARDVRTNRSLADDKVGVTIYIVMTWVRLLITAFIS